jgi:broad specificity phosphatase PhoE
MLLYLLRHGEVTSHRGDVPITPDAERHSLEVGQELGTSHPGPVRVLCGETRRARDTADHLAKGLAGVGALVTGPDVAFALRNPDLYVAGTRVNMVSSPDALAEQVDRLSAPDVASLSFFPEFFDSPDRIGWWLTHNSPPGEVAGTVADRIKSFAVSLSDPVPERFEVVVAVTHSPLLRAVGLEFLGHDIGEPPWVSGLAMTVADDRQISVDLFTADRR